MQKVALSPQAWGLEVFIYRGPRSGGGQGPDQFPEVWGSLATAQESHKVGMEQSDPVPNGDKAGTSGLCAERRDTSRVLVIQGAPAALCCCWKDTKATWEL